MAIKPISPEDRFYSQARHILETALKDLNKARLEYEASKPGQDLPKPEVFIFDLNNGKKIRIGRGKKR